MLRILQGLVYYYTGWSRSGNRRLVGDDAYIPFFAGALDAIEQPPVLTATDRSKALEAANTSCAQVSAACAELQRLTPHTPRLRMVHVLTTAAVCAYRDLLRSLLTCTGETGDVERIGSARRAAVTSALNLCVHVDALRVSDPYAYHRLVRSANWGGVLGVARLAV